MNFNPRTHKECDFDALYGLDCFQPFQSTHSQRVRLNQLYYLPFTVDISIHALTKSATLALCFRALTLLYFNPRTHKECDLVLGFTLMILKAFQSTHSQRVRPQYLDHDFNSFLNIGLQINLP